MSYSPRIRRFLRAPWPENVHGIRYLFKSAWSRVLPSVPLWGYCASAIYDSLAAMDYRWFAITRDGKLHACPRPDQFGTNLVAFLGERVAETNAFQ
jgi:hypothetical protein